MVSHPACDVAGIFADKLKLPRLNIAPVNVKDFWIVLVHADQHVARVIFKVIEYSCPHLVEWSQVSCLAALSVSDVYVEILIAAGVLSEHDFTVALPEEACNVALSC